MAAIGISLNPARKQAYLEDGTRQRSFLTSATSDSDRPAKHSPVPLYGQKQELVCSRRQAADDGEPGSMPERIQSVQQRSGDVVGAYVVAKTPGGNTSAKL